ncbi:glycosyltransferase family 39 protein [Agromyces sp. NPDC056523]|uniref:glycosyltransferase family 39 protein n=1 Tax=Agromyces sp. NPDC056523 TaxID=3345850 RepID=UPI00366E96DD
MLVVSGSWVPSLWGDEAASIMSARREWESLVALLGTVDAVHGVYYALLHVWVDLVGASPFAVRLPSALAVGAAAAGLYLLVRRRADRWVALVAACVFAVMPRVTYVATEARSMALATAIAVWTTLLLLRLLDGPARRAWWVVYAIGLAAGTYVFLYAGLLILVHVVVVVHRMARAGASSGGAAGRLHPFAFTWAGAALLAAPVAVLAIRQREQIAFRGQQDIVSLASVLVSPWFILPAVAAVAWTLMVVGVVTGVAHRHDATWSGRRELLVLAGAWVVLPAAVLLILTALVTPAFTPRYLVVSAPGVAILIAVGCSALPRLVPRVAAVAALVALAVPAYVDQRTPYAKNGRTDWQAVSAAVAELAEPGDGIVFDGQVRPSRRPRLAMHVYPEGFRGLVDLTLIRPHHETDGLWDVTAPLADVDHRLDGIDRVIVVSRSARGVDADVAVLHDAGFEPIERRALPSDTVTVFGRDGR